MSGAKGENGPALRDGMGIGEEEGDVEVGCRQSMEGPRGPAR